MKSKLNNFHLKSLYIFFVLVASINFFFSTAKVDAKAFEIKDIELSKPFELNFDKNKIIDDGFEKAFSELILSIVSSKDQKKMKNIKLSEIKGMIDSFSIKEEKFIDQTYYVNLGVSFNKKKIFNFLEKMNIFPSILSKKKFFFVPIIIDENQKDLLIFSNNQIFQRWKLNQENYHLIEYILPTEDLEDYNFIKSKFEDIEKYDFQEITNKYFLKDSIIALIFKENENIRVLSRITLNKEVVLKNQSFENINLDNEKDISTIIQKLKIIYEDYWKRFNQINTSIKLPLFIKIRNSDSNKILKFEKSLKEMDLIYNFSISKIDNNFISYEIIYNGTPNNFLKSMSEEDFNFDTKNKNWILE